MNRIHWPSVSVVCFPAPSGTSDRPERAVKQPRQCVRNFDAGAFPLEKASYFRLRRPLLRWGICDRVGSGGGGGWHLCHLGLRRSFLVTCAPVPVCLWDDPRTLVRSRFHACVWSCACRSGCGLTTISSSLSRRGRYLWERVSEIEGLDLYGPPPNVAKDNRNPLVAFNSRDVHAHDLSFFMDQARTKDTHRYLR